jgi:hypothetical protein
MEVKTVAGPVRRACILKLGSVVRVAVVALSCIVSIVPAWAATRVTVAQLVACRREIVTTDAAFGV